MTKRKRKELRYMILLVIFSMLLFGITAVRLVYGNAGWIAVTLALAGAAYYAGWQMRVRRSLHDYKRLRANASYGKRDPVTASDAVSAYPPDMTRGIVRGQAADGLASLGWPKSQTAKAINAAIDAVALTGPISTGAVITEVLRAHSKSRIV